MSGLRSVQGRWLGSEYFCDDRSTIMLCDLKLTLMKVATLELHHIFNYILDDVEQYHSYLVYGIVSVSHVHTMDMMQ